MSVYKRSKAFIFHIIKKFPVHKKYFNAMDRIYTDVQLIGCKGSGWKGAGDGKEASLASYNRWK
jgi:hypothetical protein